MGTAFPLADPSISGQLPGSRETGNIGTGPDAKRNFGGYLVFQDLTLARDGSCARLRRNRRKSYRVSCGKGAGMKRLILLAALTFLGYTVFAKECSNDDFGSFCETEAAVSRLLSYPTYTGTDEKVLNRAGDMAALALIRSISIKDFDSREKARQVLLILNLAFSAPQLITPQSSRRPTAAMLLLDHLEKPYCGQEQCNEVENIRAEIQHNTKTGAPFQMVTLKGEPPPDIGHTQWLGSVLRWTSQIRPGSTREDLIKIYTTQGGLSTPLRRTYGLKGVPYINVDVEFRVVGRPERDREGRVTPIEDGRDIITKISRPYLAYGASD